MAKPYPLYLDLLQLALFAASEPQGNLHFPLFRNAGMRVHPNPTPRRGRARGTHERARCGDLVRSLLPGLPREISGKRGPRDVVRRGAKSGALLEFQTSFEFGAVIADVVDRAGRRGAEAACERKALPAPPTQIVPVVLNCTRKSQVATGIVMSAGITTAGAICVVAGGHVNRLGWEARRETQLSYTQAKSHVEGREGRASRRHLISSPDLFLVWS